MELRWCVGLAALLTAAGQSRTSPSLFELILPDVNQSIPAGNTIADIPARPLSRMTIQLLGSASNNLNYGDLRVRVNGKGVGNVFNSGANERGKFLAMDPSTLRMRPDQIFDPRENTIEVYGKDPRGRTYYQNWILRTGRENNNAYFTYASTLSPADETGVPPDLNLDEPTGPRAFGAPGQGLSMRVRGSASAASGIERVTINGKPVKGLAQGVSFAFEQSVNVARGANGVTIEAIDRKGNRRAITVPVLYPNSATPSRLHAGQGVALVIGISRFGAKTGAPPTLPAAAFDAKRLASELELRGFSPSNIRLLVDEQATVEQVRTALGDFTARAKPEDFLLVFFATQGLHDPLSPEKIYLAAADTQAPRFSETALEVSELQLLLNRAVRSRHTLLFFDAEHSLGEEWSFHGKPIVNRYLLNLFDGPLGRSVLVSGSPGQGSQDQPENASKRGTFSAALIEGLSGKADLDHNRVITAGELCTYVAETVRRASGGSQHPQFSYSETEAESPVLALR